MRCKDQKLQLDGLRSAEANPSSSTFLSELKDAETGQCGYLIAGEDSYLDDC
jgi:CHASE3 domain sensor protein